MENGARVFWVLGKEVDPAAVLARAHLEGLPAVRMHHHITTALKRCGPMCGDGRRGTSDTAG